MQASCGNIRVRHSLRPVPLRMPPSAMRPWMPDSGVVRATDRAGTSRGQWRKNPRTPQMETVTPTVRPVFASDLVFQGAYPLSPSPSSPCSDRGWAPWVPSARYLLSDQAAERVPDDRRLVVQPGDGGEVVVGDLVLPPVREHSRGVLPDASISEMELVSEAQRTLPEKTMGFTPPGAHALACTVRLPPRRFGANLRAAAASAADSSIRWASSRRRRGNATTGPTTRGRQAAGAPRWTTWSDPRLPALLRRHRRGIKHEHANPWQ
jgi:hypothetical protein